MRTVSTPQTELTLPDDATTDRIRIPRSRQVLRLHVYALKHVKTQILTVDEVCLVDWAVLIIHDRDFVMSDTAEAEIDHALAGFQFTKIDDKLVSYRCTIGTVDIPTSKNEIGLFTLK